MAKVATLVIPCLNNRDMLRRALLSFEHQSLRNSIHVLVIDNGSTDGSLEIAQRYADEASVTQVRGAAHARNLGLTLTSTPMMLCMDSDCYPVDQYWAELLLHTLSGASPTTLAVGGVTIPCPTHDWWALRREVTPMCGFSAGSMLYVVGGNSCYRTEMVRDLGGFPVYAAYDAVTGNIARQRGLSFGYVPGARLYHQNPEGWLGYYRQMRKVGQYSAEYYGPLENPFAFGLSVLRRVGGSIRIALQGDVLEAGATMIRTVAQTQGAVATWRKP